MYRTPPQKGCNRASEKNAPEALLAHRCGRVLSKKKARLEVGSENLVLGFRCPVSQCCTMMEPRIGN